MLSCCSVDIASAVRDKKLFIDISSFLACFLFCNSLSSCSCFVFNNSVSFRCFISFAWDIKSSTLTSLFSSADTFTSIVLLALFTRLKKNSLSSKVIPYLNPKPASFNFSWKNSTRSRFCFS